MNLHIIAGRLGADPEVRETPSGTPVCNFRVATQRSYVDNQGQKIQKVEWHRIVVWGKLGSACGTHLKKGRYVTLQGESRTREWQDNDNKKRYTVEVHASSVEFGPISAPKQNVKQNAKAAVKMEEEASLGSSVPEDVAPEADIPSDAEMQAAAAILEE